MKQIIDRVFTIQGLRVGRVYVIEGDDGLTIIDTSLPGSEKRIEQDLNTRGKTLKDIRHILITHAHPDHIGSLAALQKVSGAKTYVHYRDAAVTRGQAPIPRPPKESLGLMGRMMSGGSGFPNGDPAQVDVELKEGDRLDFILPGLTVVEEPGHSPGQGRFWWPVKKLLICGDVIEHLPGYASLFRLSRMI